MLHLLAIASASSSVSGKFWPTVSGRNNVVIPPITELIPKISKGRGAQFSDSNRTRGVKMALIRAVVVASPTPMALLFVVDERGKRIYIRGGFKTQPTVDRWFCPVPTGSIVLNKDNRTELPVNRRLGFAVTPNKLYNWKERKANSVVKSVKEGCRHSTEYIKLNTFTISALLYWWCCSGNLYKFGNLTCIRNGHSNVKNFSKSCTIVSSLESN